MIVGALLMAMGALLSMAGAAIGLTAAVSSLRQYVRGTGLPPSELAMHHWRRVKTAARAGADSWRGQAPATVPTQRQAASPSRAG